MVVLCSSFLRNLAFHRAGLQGDVQRILFLPGDPQFEYWREAHVNFLDISVLEWCKIFADFTGEHHWHRVVDDKDRFKAELYAKLKVTPDAFSELIKSVKHYRDKFVAHLDEERTMKIPELDKARKSVTCLYGHLAEQATEDALDREFARCIEKAKTVYEGALSSAAAVAARR